MNRNMRIRSYCAQCQSACPIICSVEDGKLVKVDRDPDHPNATSLCPKGLAGPELAYNSQRLRYPLKRTHPKGDPDPGWKRISWDEAMETITQKISEIKEKHGAHAVAFNRPGPNGSPAQDYADWFVRLALCFGSPNYLATGHVCQWHRDTGSKYTYGWERVPEVDFENTALLIIWGHNPHSSVRGNVRDIEKAVKKGAKLVVIDPRYTPVAKKADLWLQIRPGTDGALMLGLIHLLIKEERYDQSFVTDWTNAPFLVREDTADLLTADDLGMQPPGGYLVRDKGQKELAVYCPERSTYAQAGIDPELSGTFQVKLSGGQMVQVRTVFDYLRDLVDPYTPDAVESITGVSDKNIRDLAGCFGQTKPVSYYPYNGLEQHTNAMQTNRALCILYALTGNLDSPGGNVFFPSIPGFSARDPKLLSEDIHKLRLGYEKRPLGPAGIPASNIQAYEVFDSVLTGKPYPIKALVAFGGNIVIANSNSLAAREALMKLDFFAQIELFMTPSAELADLVLPAATFFESFNIKRGFPNTLAAHRWVQYRPRIIAPLYETRSDLEIIFDMAVRLGLGDRFWNGDIEAAFNDQLQPAGLDLDMLKENPGGVSVDVPMVHRKFAQIDKHAGTPRGFATPSRRVEIYSQLFKDHGYDPLPAYREPRISPVSKQEWAGRYPLILTCSKLLHFCHGQHRAVPSLRKAVPHPFVEINPVKARELNIENNEWVRVETPLGKIKVKAKLTDGIDTGVVCIQHGWWQSCPELGLQGYDPYSSDGANANILFGTDCIDEISGSVPYKAYLCNVAKI